MNTLTSEIVMSEDLARDIREIKEEIRHISDNQIRLEEKFKAHFDSCNVWQGREEQYRKDFIQRVNANEVRAEHMNEQMKENSHFRKVATKHIWLIWSGLILSGIATLVKFVLLK